MTTAYSYSRLTTYDKCSELYRLMYQVGLGDVRQDTFHTRLGSYCHSALESFYNCTDGSVASPYEALTGPKGIWDTELTKLGLDPVREDLNRYAGHMTKLYARANHKYKGHDAIRTKDGKVTESPQFTTPGREYIRQFGLDTLATKVDRMAAALSENWQTVSLSDVYAQSQAMLYQYKNPEEIDTVVMVELGISDIYYQAADEEGKPLKDSKGKPIVTLKARGDKPLWKDPEGKPRIIQINAEQYMPSIAKDGSIERDDTGEIKWSKTGLFHGYIDLIARDKEGRLMVIDHKTSKEMPTEAKVSRHEQLLAYGWAVSHLTGEDVYAIGINDLRRNKLILAKFDMVKALEAVKRLASIQRGIEAGVFIKRDPQAYETPCVRKSKTNEYTLCPGLKYCHEEVYKSFHTFTSDEDVFS